MSRGHQIPICVLVSVIAHACAIGRAQEPSVPQEPSVQRNSCATCHGNPELWKDGRARLLVGAEELTHDAHWQNGIYCNECHGGDPNSFDFFVAHAVEGTFKKAPTKEEIPALCGRCHSDANYMKQFKPDAELNQAESFWNSVHGKHLRDTPGPESATCTSCHTTHDIRPVEDPLASVHPTRLALTCGKCHQQQLTDLRKSVHDSAGAKNAHGSGSLLDCLQCHATNVHGMGPAKDPGSPVVGQQQIRTCGACHSEYMERHLKSAHGETFELVDSDRVAVCISCHGSHAIFRAVDKRSLLHKANISDTCGKCHPGVAPKVNQSIHAVSRSTIETSRNRDDEDGQGERLPSCIDCHQRHDELRPDSLFVHLSRQNRCGNCHANLMHHNRMIVHGELTETGYQPAAECSQCHGAHEILAIDDADSRLAGANRQRTCRSCHATAGGSFSNFDPHAYHKDTERSPGLHRAHNSINLFILGVFGVFIVHSGLWFSRTFRQTLQHGPQQTLVTEERAVVRFGKALPLAYVLLLVSIMGLMVTGLPMMYSNQAWAPKFADLLGGFRLTSLWHRMFATVVLAAGAYHLYRAARWIQRSRARGASYSQLFFGPDSTIPISRDLRDFRKMLNWFFGRGPKPTFERWTYWEKIDYWVFLLAIIVISMSGLVQWFPSVFGSFLPGTVINLAQVVHADLALPAAGLLFIVHVFNTHLRPEKFPLDLSFVTGLVSEEHLKRARPEYLERLSREGRLNVVRRSAPSHRFLRLVTLAGAATLTIGLVVLIAVVLVMLSK